MLRSAALCVVAIRVFLAACGVFLVVSGLVQAGQSYGPRPGRILIIRGAMNVFSLGLDELACRLTQLGYRVDVTPPSMASVVAQQIQDEYLQNPSSGPLVIIGHSLGGRHCCSIPWKWRERNIPVRLVVILDSNPQTPVADNVQRCVNLYVTNNLGIFHGQSVWSVSPGSDLVNTDVTRLSRPPGVGPVDHFNIDDSDWIQGMIVREVQCALEVSDGPQRTADSLPVQEVSASRPVVKAPSYRGARSATSRYPGLFMSDPGFQPVRTVTTEQLRSR